MPPPNLDRHRREVVFAALIAVQDGDTPLARVRELVALMFGLTVAQVTAIEQEGVVNAWDPL